MGFDLFVDITAPNGRTYKQPTGLFINNEFRPSSNGQTIVSLDPAYEIILRSYLEWAVANLLEPTNPLLRCTPPARMTLISR